MEDAWSSEPSVA